MRTESRQTKGRIAARKGDDGEARHDLSADQRAPAVTRAVGILRLLARSDRPLGVNAIASALNLVPSTGLHILRALAQEGIVSVEPATKHYSLGPGLLTLAHDMLRKNTFINVAQPVLDDLSSRHRLTAIGVQVNGLDHFVVVAISRSKIAYRVHVDVGSRFPALISATGRCIAAFGGFDWPALEQKFRTLRWDVPPSLATWRTQVQQARQQGYSIDQGNYIRGMTICAAPVLDSRNQMTHAIITLGLAEQMQQDGLVALAEELKSVADCIGAHLGAGNLDSSAPAEVIRLPDADHPSR